MSDLKKFAEALIQRLRDLDRTATWLAERLNISPSTVTRWLNGENRPQHPDMVIRIADVLGIYQREDRQQLLSWAGYAYMEGTAEAEPVSNEGDIIEGERPQNYLLRWLPLSAYDRLFGVEMLCEKIMAYLDLAHKHNIISIQGIGGIGKTTLADFVVRSWLSKAPAIHDVLWVSAKQQSIHTGGIIGSTIRINLNALFNDIGEILGDEVILRQPLPQKVRRLATKFRDKPYLVVIDNLEAVEDFEVLAKWLGEIADPTKFILTSRENVPDLAPVTYVKLNELDENASLSLIEHIAQEKDVTGFDAKAVYKLVGGNPLAIVLTVSQMQEILPSKLLTGIKLGTSEDIYRYVYWNAWQALSQEARKILLTVQRSGDKATWASITRRTQLTSNELIPAIQQLVRFSLIQPPARQTKNNFYSIHRLTSTFLQAEVLQWK